MSGLFFGHFDSYLVSVEYQKLNPGRIIGLLKNVDVSYMPLHE